MATILDEILGDIGLPTVQAVSPRRQRVSYTPEQEQSILSKLGNTALSGLSLVGNVLDVPGSMVRDIVGGENPFDQLLTPTAPDNRLSGRDVLTKWGITAPNDPNAWEAADFGGFAAELAFDPMTYLTFGGSALSKGGQVAKNAGLLSELSKFAGKTIGPREARLTTTLEDLVRIPKTATEFTTRHDGVMNRDYFDTFARGPAGEDRGRITGSIGNGRLKADLSFVDDALKGQGIGGDMYRRAVDESHARGFDFASDIEVSPDAQRVYQSLAREGYQVTRNPRSVAEARPGGEYLVSNHGPVFTVKPGTGAAKRQAVQRAAEAMGEDITKLADQPLGGLFGIGLPFRAPSFVIGTGTRSVELARKLDDWARRAQFAKIPGTDLAPLSALNRLFNAKAGDASSQVGQRNVLPSIVDSRKAARAQARGAVGDVALDLMARGGHLANEDQARALRRLYEGVDVASSPEVAQHVDKVRGVLDPMIAEANEWGLYGSELFDSKINYFPRFMSKELRDVQGSRRIVSAFDPQMTGRHEYLKDLGQGTDTIYQMLDDQHIKYAIDSGMKIDDLAQLIGNRYGADVPNAYINSATQSVENRREAIARWFTQMDDDVRASGVFGNHPVQDLAARLQSGYETLSVGKEVLRQLADPTTLREAARTTRTPGQFVKLKQVLDKIGFVSGDENGGALKKFLELTGHANADKKIIDAAGSIPVPADFADDLNRYIQSFKSPEAANEILQAVDSVTNLFKGGVTSPWPAFHVRNLMSGQWQNWAAGQWSARSMRDANSIMRGQSSADLVSIPVVRSELQRLGLQATPDNAADVVRRMAWQHNVVSKYESVQAAGAPTAVGSTFGDFLTELPGGVAQGRGTPFQPTDAYGMLMGKGTTWNPLQSTVQGVAGATDTTFAPMAAGQHLGHYIEGLNRLTPFIENLRKGVDPAEAAARVAATQVEYGGRAYTAFEKGVAARLFPFYKFSKGMIPYTLSRLWEAPGGKLAQTIRAQNRASGNDASTPDYVAESASIPWPGGQLEDGSKRYITGFGLPMEDAMSFLGGGVRGGLMEAIGRANPLVKAPLEWATGESFFQKGPQGGRDLEDLDPTIGRIISNISGDTKPADLPDGLEFIAANLPIARALTTLRTITDPRKRDLAGLMNLATGVRVSDVSPGAQDAVIRERSNALMRELGAKAFTRVYFPKEDVAGMAPAEQEQALRLQLLQNILAERAKDRKAAKQSP